MYTTCAAQVVINKLTYRQTSHADVYKNVYKIFRHWVHAVIKANPFFRLVDQ